MVSWCFSAVRRRSRIFCSSWRWFWLAVFNKSFDSIKLFSRSTIWFDCSSTSWLVRDSCERKRWASLLNSTWDSSRFRQRSANCNDWDWYSSQSTREASCSRRSLASDRWREVSSSTVVLWEAARAWKEQCGDAEWTGERHVHLLQCRSGFY